MLKLYLIGLSILIVAIIANVVASTLGLLSWYDTLTMFGKEGRSAFKQIRIIDWVWLIIIYPVLLGLGYKLGSLIFELFGRILK